MEREEYNLFFTRGEIKMANIRFNEVCVALENATPKRVAELVKELVSLTVNGMAEQPNPGLCNRACDATRYHSAWSKWVRAYMLEFMPFSIQASTGRFGGKMRQGWNVEDCPEFTGWLTAQKEQAKAEKTAVKEKAEAEKLAAQKQAELDAEAEEEAEEAQKIRGADEIRVALVQSIREAVNHVPETMIIGTVIRELHITPDKLIAILKTMA